MFENTGVHSLGRDKYSSLLDQWRHSFLLLHPFLIWKRCTHVSKVGTTENVRLIFRGIFAICSQSKALLESNINNRSLRASFVYLKRMGRHSGEDFCMEHVFTYYCAKISRPYQSLWAIRCCFGTALGCGKSWPRPWLALFRLDDPFFFNFKYELKKKATRFQETTRFVYCIFYMLSSNWNRHS